MTLLHLPNAKTIPAGCISSTDLATRAGLSYRQLDYWTRVGYLTPINPDQGCGTVRYYPRSEVPAATLIGRLVSAGLTPQVARLHARELLDTGTTQIAGFTIHLPEEH